MRIGVVHRPGLGYGREHPFAAPNPVYAAVDSLLVALGFDVAHAGTPAFNPLAELIGPGDRVIVKPNFVSARNLHEAISGAKLEASSTHASLLRPILDYALRAAGPRGQVTVVDTPVEGCELGQVIGPLGVAGLIAELARQHPQLSFHDLRGFRVVPYFAVDDLRRRGRSYNLGLLVRRALPGDPRGYRAVDLGARSYFAAPEVRAEQLSFHRSHRATPRPHHRGGRHEYSLPQTVLDADVVINLAKMKTHKKSGVTLSLKSVIGLTNEKYWLPHFTAGDPGRGGDEYDRPQAMRDRVEDQLSRLPLPGGHSLVARMPRLERPPRVIDGSWEGNDTLWRTILDLNHILFHADRQGRLCAAPQRRCLSIVDGIIAGEGEGPMGATPLAAGLLVGGLDPVLVDHECAALMGFDPLAIPHIARALDRPLLPTSAVDLIERIVDGVGPDHHFTPPRSWPSLRSGPLSPEPERNDRH